MIRANYKLNYYNICPAGLQERLFVWYDTICEVKHTCE